MAEQWFYSAGGTKHGPVPSKELVALARSGKLSPTDLVWKEGMAEWKPAGKVKGLFPTNPALPPPLPTPAPSAKPPDLAAATKGLFGAVATAAQQAVAKATEATKPAPGSPLRAARLHLAGRQKKGVLVVGAVVAVCVVALVVAALAGLPFGKVNGTGTPGEAAANLNGEGQPATTVADAEKKARAEATQLLPAAGELEAHVEQLQADLAEFRKSVEADQRTLDQILRSGLGADGKDTYGLFDVQFRYRQSAEEYDLKNLGKVLDDVAKQRAEKADKVRDPVIQFLDEKAKLETGLRKLIADNSGAKGGGVGTEYTRKELADFKKKGPPQVEVFTAEQIAKKWQAARQKAYDELKGNDFELQRLKKMHADEDRLEAMASEAKRRFVLEDYEKRLKTLENNLAEAERKEGEGVKAANATQVAAAKKLLERLEIIDTEDLRQSWSQATQRYGEVLGAVKQMRERVEKLRPVPPNDLLRELEVVSGITHLIEGDMYYVENKVVRIPAKYAPVYVHDRVQANTAAFSNHFRFKGNTTGKNGFGATIPVALYECDERHAEILLREREFGKQAGPFLKLFPQEKRELEYLRVVIGHLTGQEALAKAVAEARTRLANDTKQRAEARRIAKQAKPAGGNAGAVAPPEPPAKGVPKDDVLPAPARPPMQGSKMAVPAVPEPKAVVPAKPKLIPVYKVVFPGDVLLTTNEEEVKNIVKVYPGEFKGDKGHWTGTFGYAYAERQEGTVLLRRYLVGNKRVFTTRKLDNPNYKEEGMGAWVSERERDGTTLRLGFFRKKDAAKEYGPEKTTEFFGKLGYSPSELKFYMFDKSELP